MEFLKRDEEEEEREGEKVLSMLGSDDVEGIGKGEVEEGGWGNHIIGEGEGGGEGEEEESVVAPRSTRPKRKSLTKYGSVLSHFYFILITAKHLG